MKYLTSISILNYSSLWRFISVIFFTWERLGLINFLLHFPYWFHRWLFNIVYVQYRLLQEMSSLHVKRSHIENLPFAQNGQLTKLAFMFKIYRHSRVNADCSLSSMKWLTSFNVMTYSPFLRFIHVIWFLWEKLGSINFLLFVVNWLHRWFFNIMYA